MILKFKQSVCLYILCVFCLPASAGTTQDNETAIVSYATNKPLIYPESGRAKGVYPDILRAVFEDQFGVKLEFQNRPWKRAQADVKSGRSDIIVTVPTQERLGYVVATETPIYQLKRRLYTYPSHPRMPEILRMKDTQSVVDARFKMAAVIGDGWFKEKLLSKGVSANLVPDPRNSFRLLSDLRVDLVITSPSVYSNVMATEGLEDKIFDTGVDLEKLNVHILIGTKSAYAARIKEINQAIIKLQATGKLTAIYRKY